MIKILLNILYLQFPLPSVAVNLCCALSKLFRVPDIYCSLYHASLERVIVRLLNIPAFYTLYDSLRVLLRQQAIPICP